MTTARLIIQLAYDSMSGIGETETISAAAFTIALRRLNNITDDWSSGRDMMFQDVITSGAVTGTSLSLTTGAFATVGLAQEISTMNCDGYPMEPITMQQYNNIYLKTQPGRPQVWVQDGAGTVYLYPAATGNTINMVTRQAMVQFADLDTAYAMPSGYQGALSATLAVQIAPAVIGKVTQELINMERKAMFNIQNSTVRPAILSANPLAKRNFGGTILQGFR